MLSLIEELFSIPRGTRKFQLFLQLAFSNKVNFTYSFEKGFAPSGIGATSAAPLRPTRATKTRFRLQCCLEEKSRIVLFLFIKCKAQF